MDEEDAFETFKANAESFEIMLIWYKHAQAAGFSQQESLLLIAHMFMAMMMAPRLYSDDKSSQ